MKEYMTFNVNQKVTLIDGRHKFTMTVIGQRKEYVALGTDDCIEVFTLTEYDGKTYLLTNDDGGPNTCYKFKIEEN